MDAEAVTVADLYAEYVAAKARFDTLTARYNSEYRAGRWTTNRELAGASEDAYSDMYRAERAWQQAVDAAEDADASGYAVDGDPACEDCGGPCPAVAAVCRGCLSARHAADWQLVVRRG